ncbi:hypothetical protein LINPERPRIM_LOCUS12941 [Linum perenne]
MDLDSPSLASIALRLPGVMNPQFSPSYIWKASFKSRSLSSSSPASISSTKSSRPSMPSSDTDNRHSSSSSLVKPRPRWWLSSEGDILPSPSSSRCRKTRSKSRAAGAFFTITLTI